MLGIYADVIRTATRTDRFIIEDVPPANAPKRRRWFNRPRAIDVDLSKL